MISRVIIKNFKSIGEAGVDLDLKPLTLLVGPNGGGKSSILEAIAVASQGNLSGNLVNLPTRESVLHQPTGANGFIGVFFTSNGFDVSPDVAATFTRATNMRLDILTENQARRQEVGRLQSQLESNTFLMSSVRGDVPFSADTAGNPLWVGVHGADLLLVLAMIFGQGRYEDIAHRITKWADCFGARNLKAGFRGTHQSGSDYMDTELKARLDLYLASAGARQILTVITQLFWAPPGSLLLIEEPEISLHPKAQIDVLEMFAEGIREGKQIIATTHSLILLQALGYAVLKGWLTRDQMAVHHVEKRKGGTTARLLPLAKNGYIRNWVPSFTKVERHLLREWAKTLPRA